MSEHVRQEGEVAGWPIQSGDHQGDAEELAIPQGGGESETVVVLTALHVDIFAGQFPVSVVQVGEDGVALRLEAEAVGTLGPIRGRWWLRTAPAHGWMGSPACVHRSNIAAYTLVLMVTF